MCLWASNYTKSWMLARADCEDRRGNLVVIDTADKQTHVEKYLSSLDSFKPNSRYLALRVRV